MVICDSTDETERVFGRGLWLMGRAGLFMMRWYGGFIPKDVKLSMVAIWIRMYGLPI